LRDATVTGKLRGLIDVAVKKMKAGSMTALAFLEEARTLHHLRHQRLVQLIGICWEPLSILTEFMVNGSLLEYLYDDGGRLIRFPTLADMAAQVV
jgi:serine/threonine protein kinase